MHLIFVGAAMALLLVTWAYAIACAELGERQ